MTPSLSLFVHYIKVIILNYATILLVRLGLQIFQNSYNILIIVRLNTKQSMILLFQ